MDKPLNTASCLFMGAEANKSLHDKAFFEGSMTIVCSPEIVEICRLDVSLLLIVLTSESETGSEIILNRLGPVVEFTSSLSPHPIASPFKIQ